MFWKLKSCIESFTKGSCLVFSSAVNNKIFRVIMLSLLSSEESRDVFSYL